MISGKGKFYTAADLLKCEDTFCILPREGWGKYLNEIAGKLNDYHYDLVYVDKKHWEVYELGYYRGTLSCLAGLEFKAPSIECLTARPDVEREYEAFFNDVMYLLEWRHIDDQEYIRLYDKVKECKHCVSLIRNGGNYLAYYRGHIITELLNTEATAEQICQYINIVEDGCEYYG